MDLTAINRDPLLKRTPLGRLSLERYGRGAQAWIGVVARAPGVPNSAPGVIIGTYDPNKGDVFGCAYGRRWFERKEMLARWAAQQEREAAAQEKAEVESSEEGVELFAAAIATDRKADRTHQW